MENKKYFILSELLYFSSLRIILFNIILNDYYLKFLEIAIQETIKDQMTVYIGNWNGLQHNTDNDTSHMNSREFVLHISGTQNSIKDRYVLTGVEFCHDQNVK